MAPLILVLMVSLLLVAHPTPTAAGRNVASLSKWARNEGIFLHDKVEWKDYGDEDWGLVLKDRVERGTVLIKVPRSLVLDSTVLRKDNQSSSKDCVEVVKEALGELAIHEANFWIVLQLYRLKCQQPSPHRFSPWIDAMPDSFPQFTPDEMDCLPFYAKFAAQYRDKKFHSFCQAMEALSADRNGGFSTKNPDDVAKYKWAFNAVNSRFWKTNPSNYAKEMNMEQTSELVPIGDMMNHRDPPNVQMVPEDVDHVCFAYMGDDADEEHSTDSRGENKYERDLFLSYGHPGNPHRFLCTFGFVPHSQYMPYIWSHLAYSDSNPYGSAAQADKMVFHVDDGTVPQQVFDAILWELWQPASHEEFLRDKDERHATYRDLIVGVLESHVDRELEELASLQPKMQVTEGPYMAMIRQYNEFLTSVFAKVKNNLH